MGSRVGIRVVNNRSGVERYSIILRQQHISGIEEGVRSMWSYLEGGAPGDGALRDDLDIDRASVAMTCSFAQPPFDSHHQTHNCNIEDNGLIEIDITKWDEWIISQRNIGERLQNGRMDYNALNERTRIAKMSARGFTWLKTKEQLKNIGEGLF